MIPLMQKRTFFTKWVLPFALTALIFLWFWYQELVKPDPHYGELAIACMVGLVILFFVIRRRGSQEPDEVLDGGTFLQVRFGDRIEVVQLSDVEHVHVAKLIRLVRITLFLRASTQAGRAISFYPIQKDDAVGQNAVGASLRARVSSHGAAA
jgi:hypothetical protein